MKTDMIHSNFKYFLQLYGFCNLVDEHLKPFKDTILHLILL